MPILALFPTAYFPLPDLSGSVSLGQVYIGNIDTDPTVLGNRVTVTIIEEDGTEVPILAAAQPLELNIGGQFVYNGSVVQVQVDTNYSMTVLDSAGAQVYYFPNSNFQIVDQDVQNSAATILNSVAGTNTLTASLTPTLTAYVVGQIFHGIAQNSNTGATTLNINSLGAGAIQLNNAALTGGELLAGAPFQVQVTSVAPIFELVSQANNTVVRTFLGQITQALLRTAGLGISSAMDAVITAASLALGRVALGFSADTYLGGVGTTPAYSAGDFTAAGAMTWTVGAGDVTTYRYVINGKFMTVFWTLATTSIGGTPSAAVQIAIPAGKTATVTVYGLCKVDNGVVTTGYFVVSGTTISISKEDGIDFTAGTDDTFVGGQATFEIN